MYMYNDIDFAHRHRHMCTVKNYRRKSETAAMCHSLHKQNKILGWKEDTHTHTQGPLISISPFVSSSLAYLLLIHGQESQSDLIARQGGREPFWAAGIHWEQQEKTGRASHWIVIVAHTLRYIMLLIRGCRYAAIVHTRQAVKVDN